MSRAKVFLYSDATCRKRRLDLKRIETFLIKNHYEIVDTVENADYLIQMTCAFSTFAEKRALEKTKELIKYPGRLIICGCIGGIAPTNVRKIFTGPLITTEDIQKIDHFFEHEISFKSLKDLNEPWFNRGEIIEQRVRERFYIQVSRGCTGACAFCAIRNSIGGLVSKPLIQCIEEFQEGLQEGYKRFKLLADDIGAYGLDIDSTFAELLNALTSFEGDYVIERLHEIHPKWLMRYRREIFAILQTNKIVGINIALQSANSRVLKLMRRPLKSISALKETCLEIKREFPDLELSITMIVNFPTETKDELYDSLKFVADIGFESGSFFSYTDREGTIASNIIGKIDETEKTKRMQEVKGFLEKENYVVIMMEDYSAIEFSASRV